MLKMEDAHELLKREKMRFRQQRRLDRGMPKSVRLARLATDRSLKSCMNNIVNSGTGAGGHASAYATNSWG